METEVYNNEILKPVTGFYTGSYTSVDENGHVEMFKDKECFLHFDELSMVSPPPFYLATMPITQSKRYSLRGRVISGEGDSYSLCGVYCDATGLLQMSKKLNAYRCKDSASVSKLPSGVLK